MDSEKLRTLPMDSRVCVVEKVGRRVRICSPINGWCSMTSSKDGHVILTKLDNQDQSAHKPQSVDVSLLLFRLILMSQ